MTDRGDRLRALMAQWRERAAMTGRWLGPAWDAYKQCADDLEALLTAEDAPARKGFSYEKSQRIGQKALALADWFREYGERPDEWMDLFAEIIISDEPITEAELRRTLERLCDPTPAREGE